MHAGLLLQCNLSLKIKNCWPDKFWSQIRQIHPWMQNFNLGSENEWPSSDSEWLSSRQIGKMHLPFFCYSSMWFASDNLCEENFIRHGWNSIALNITTFLSGISLSAETCRIALAPGEFLWCAFVQTHRSYWFYHAEPNSLERFSFEGTQLAI